MAPQTKITLTNFIGIASIVLTIGGSAGLLYAAVVSNNSSQIQINTRHDKEINALIEKEKRDDERWMAVVQSQARIEGALGIRKKEQR